MSDRNYTIYLDLPIDVKNSIQDRLKENKDLKIGFYSQDYYIYQSGKKVSYRFHAIEQCRHKNFTIKFESDFKKHNPYTRNNKIYFYDEDLKQTLHIKKNLFDETLEKEIDFNLSTEQKELLAEGKDITLNLTIKTLNKKVQLNNVSKKELKNFVAEYSFFLGKCSLFIQEKNKITTSKTLSLNKNN